MTLSDAIIRARKHNEIVQRMEFVLRSDPTNRVLALGLGSARRRAARSAAELEQFAASDQVDLVQYRLQHPNETYAAGAVSGSLEAFQNAFTAAADRAVNGAKTTAHYSQDIKNDSRLNFGYSYAGSLGMVLSVNNDRSLLDGGRFDAVADVFDQFLNVSNGEQAQSAHRDLGGAAINQLYKWSVANAQWETSVDFLIKRSNGTQRGQHVPHAKFVQLSDIFKVNVEDPPRTFPVSGILVGLDIKLDKFHFVEPDGENYKGNLSEDFQRTHTTVGERYTAEICERVTRVIATGSEKTSHSLISLTPPE